MQQTNLFMAESKQSLIQARITHLKYKSLKTTTTGLKARLSEQKKEIQRLEDQLQAKQIGKPVHAATPKAPSGSCVDWIKAAGVKDVANAHALIMRESGCNPNARNASSGACGLGQQLPCGKWPHAWNDPIGGIKDMQAYVFGRYGSWAAANSFQLANGWY